MCDDDICGKCGAFAGIASAPRVVCARLGCAVKTVVGNRRCCADGAIFDAREVRFDGWR